MAKNFLPCGHIREFFAEGRSTTRRISRPFRTATAGGLGPGPPHRVRFGSGESAARHFVVVLDPRTSAGPSVSLGLTYRTLPGLAATLLPSVLPPELPTGMRLVPMVRDWLGLGWTAEHGWSVLEGPNGVVANDAQAADPERSKLVFRSNCSGKPAILCVLIEAQMRGQCVRYLLCGLVPAAQGGPPLSRGGP